MFRVSGNKGLHPSVPLIFNQSRALPEDSANSLINGLLGLGARTSLSPTGERTRGELVNLLN